jgi:hypothetical protein
MRTLRFLSLRHHSQFSMVVTAPRPLRVAAVGNDVRVIKGTGGYPLAHGCCENHLKTGLSTFKKRNLFQFIRLSGFSRMICMPVVIGWFSNSRRVTSCSFSPKLSRWGFSQVFQLESGSLDSHILKVNAIEGHLKTGMRSQGASLRERQ